MTNSSLSQKLLELSTSNTSGGENILNKDILQTYEKLNPSTVMFLRWEFLVYKFQNNCRCDLRC